MRRRKRTRGDACPRPLNSTGARARLRPAELVQVIVVHAEVMGDLVDQRAADFFVQAIEVESHLGMGTHFTVYLPCREVELESRVVPLPITNSRSSKVMLVDDEEWILDVASRLLSSLGIELEAFSHPLEASERFISAPGEFDLLITDQNMPNMKGMELIETVRGLRAELSCILMSGNVSPLQQDSEVLFMSKPFRIGDLKSVLQMVGILDQNGKTTQSN